MLTNSENHFMLTDKAYEFFKKLVQIVLPAIGSLYFGLASIYDLPSADKVVGTIVLITTFLGAVLGISNAQYKKSDAAFDGAMVVTPGEDKTMFSLELKSEPEDIVDKDSIRFRVHQAERPLHADRE